MATTGVTLVTFTTIHVSKYSDIFIKILGDNEGDVISRFSR